MKITQIDLANKQQVRDFLDLPFRIYKDIPGWVPPLQMDERRRLDPKRYPFYRHSRAGFFLAYDGARALGRLAVLDHRLYNQHNNEKTAFFYLFECEHDQQAASALFAAACDWARARGLTKILGPKGFTVLDGFGLLVKGFEHRPAFGLPYNPSYYPGLIEAAGFQPERDALSGYLGPDIRFPPRVHQLAERIARRRGLRIARYRTRKDLRAFVPGLKALYNSALRGTASNAPLTDEEAHMMANQLLWFSDPRLLKVIMKVADPRQGAEGLRQGEVDPHKVREEPVGFLMAYPDISAALQKTRGRLFPFGWITLLREFRRTEWLNINGAGLLPEYRGLGGTAILYSELFKAVVETGQFKHADIVQIGTENENMLRELEQFGVNFYKVHRTYVRTL
jgi:GNAT superfamily N-acetyltransferase